MSAEFGLVFNIVFFSSIWTIISVIIDKIVPIFNRTCATLLCMEDGVSAFGMLLMAWRFLLVVIWIGCLINYLITKNNASVSNMEV